MMNAHGALRRRHDLDMLRALCADGTLLTSEIRAAPLTEAKKPPAEPPQVGAGTGPHRPVTDDADKSLPVVDAE